MSIIMKTIRRKCKNMKLVEQFTRNKKKPKYNKIYATNGQKQIVITIKTVSYTHLDVYKRQKHNWVTR